MKILQNFPVLKNFFEILNFNLYVSQYFLILFCIEDIYFIITIVMQRQRGFVKIVNTIVAFDSKFQIRQLFSQCNGWWEAHKSWIVGYGWTGRLRQVTSPELSTDSELNFFMLPILYTGLFLKSLIRTLTTRAKDAKIKRRKIFTQHTVAAQRKDSP